MECQPSFTDLEECVRSLKDRKSLEGYGHPDDLFKYGCEGLIRKLHNLFLVVWEAEALPKDWKESIVL